LLYCLKGNSEVLKRLFIEEKAKKHVVLWPQDDDKLEKLKRLFSSNSLFGGIEAVRIIDFDKWRKPEKEMVIDLLKRIQVKSEVFLETNKTYDLECKTLNFSRPQPWKPKDWHTHIDKIARKLGVMIEKRAISTLFQNSGPDEMLIYSELKKLKSLGKTITHEDILKYSFVSNRINLELLAIKTITGQHNGLFEKLQDLAVNFSIFLSVVTGILIDIGRLKEETSSIHTPDWKEIQSISKTTGIALGRTARLMGFSFSGSTETSVNTLKYFSSKKLNKVLIELQKLDEKLKTGNSDQSFVFLELLHIFQTGN